MTTTARKEKTHQFIGLGSAVTVTNPSISESSPNPTLQLLSKSPSSLFRTAPGCPLGHAGPKLLLMQNSSDIPKLFLELMKSPLKVAL